MPVAQSFLGLPGRWPKASDHLVIVEYRLPDGRDAEVLLRVNKNRYSEVVSALQSMLPNSVGFSPD